MGLIQNCNTALRWILKSEAPGNDVSGYADRQEDLLDSRFMNYQVILFELQTSRNTCNKIRLLPLLMCSFRDFNTASTGKNDLNLGIGHVG